MVECRAGETYSGWEKITRGLIPIDLGKLPQKPKARSQRVGRGKNMSKDCDKRKGVGQGPRRHQKRKPRM